MTGVQTCALPILALHPFEYDYAPSPNINGLCNLPYSASRIHYPMVRESYLKDGPASREKRGTDRWVRVSWDQALDLVANEMKRIYVDFGPSANLRTDDAPVACRNA